MPKNKIDFKIHNNANLSRKRVEFQFNFKIEKIKLYNKVPSSDIPCNVRGLDTDTIVIIFQNPVTRNQQNIGIVVEGESSGKPRINRVIWITEDELTSHDIETINRNYF